jgi:hypothetical protein
MTPVASLAVTEKDPDHCHNEQAQEKLAEWREFIARVRCS